MKKLKKIIKAFFAKICLPCFVLFPQGVQNFFRRLSERTYLWFQATKFHRPALAILKIDDVSFKLWLLAGHSGAQATYLRMAQEGEVYEEIMVRCVRHILDYLKKPVFVDVGAFMGYYACYAAQLQHDSRPVFAIESNPAYCRTIQRSIDENGFKNAKVLEAVLSDRREVLNVYKETVTGKDDPLGEKLQAVTFDDICLREKIAPTVLKIDVHGAEGKVIGGAQRILKESVEVILWELHPDDYLEKYSPGYTRKDILKILEKGGFRNYLAGGFRYKRSPERKVFFETGQITCVEILPENKDLLFFDRHVDLFIFSLKGRTLTDFPCFRLLASEKQKGSKIE